MLMKVMLLQYNFKRVQCYKMIVFYLYFVVWWDTPITLVLRQYLRLQFLLLQFSSGINIRFFDNFQISSMFESSFVTIFKWQMFFCCKSPCTRLSQF